ncbi:MAG: phosphate-starvation-inducible PsiE family protein [Blastocatellia bacterium]
MFAGFVPHCILDVHDMSSGHLLGLAAITLVLGVTYWLIREHDDPLADVSHDPKA